MTVAPKRSFYAFKTSMSGTIENGLAPSSLSIDEFHALTYKQIYDLMPKKEVTAEDRDTIRRGSGAILEILSQWLWMRQGQTYAKVWPAIAAQLGGVSYDIPTSEFPRPFPVFEIRLPKEDNPMVEPGQPPLRSMLVCTSIEAIRGASPEIATHLDDAVDQIAVMGDRLTIWCDFGEDNTVEGLPNLKARSYVYLNMKLDPVGTIAQAFEEAVAVAVSNRDAAIPVGGDSPPGDYYPSKDFFGHLLSLAVGASFFLDDRHELVLPDIAPKFKERAVRAERTKDVVEMKRVIDQSRKVGYNGYNVGAELSLPRRPSTPPVATTGEGGRRALQFGYLRDGHMRYQRYGEGRAHRRLMFIRPTQVRPDLPMAATKGKAFKIRDT